MRPSEVRKHSFELGDYTQSQVQSVSAYKKQGQLLWCIKSPWMSDQEEKKRKQHWINYISL